MTSERRKHARAYIRRIRNQAKHDYAIAVYVELVNGRDGDQAISADDDSLSVMARQAVRMRLAAILDPS